MYSRNHVDISQNKKDRNITDFRKLTASGQNSNVPIRSFTDNFAYERFNKMGISNEINIEESYDSSQNNPEPNKDITTEKSDSEHSDLHGNTGDDSTISNYELQNIQEKTVIGKNEYKTEPSFFGELIKLGDLIQGDFILVVLAIALTLFGNKETNDKLTPIALLAIMFF